MQKIHFYPVLFDPDGWWLGVVMYKQLLADHQSLLNFSLIPFSLLVLRLKCQYNNGIHIVQSSFRSSAAVMGMAFINNIY